jgi:hypothetical protein
MDESDDAYFIFRSISPGTEHCPTARTTWPTLGTALSSSVPFHAEDNHSLTTELYQVTIPERFVYEEIGGNTYPSEFNSMRDSTGSGGSQTYIIADSNHLSKFNSLWLRTRTTNKMSTNRILSRQPPKAKSF